MSGILPKKWAVRTYKEAGDAAWVVFIGGTGTGKSTLFNALCGKALSDTGVERPKTRGPIAFVHRESRLDEGFPFPEMQCRQVRPEADAPLPLHGNPGQLLCLEHAEDRLRNIVLVDTPDVDSLEIRNRLIVEDLYLLADLVIFVASEEKYADDVPFQFLKRIQAEGKWCTVIVNKAGALLQNEDVGASFAQQGVTLPVDRFWILPFAPAEPLDYLPGNPAFRAMLAQLLTDLDPLGVPDLRQREVARANRELARETRRLVDLLTVEDAAGKQWLDHLDLFFRSSCRTLLEQQERHLTEEHREAIQKEIRKLYSRYDLLGGPRRAVAQAVRIPLRALGLVGESRNESHRESLLRIRERIDLAPIQAAVDGFNRHVLEKLSPQDETSPLYGRLRDPGLALTRDVIRQIVWEEQERLAGWLEGTFDELARGIPRSKEWGIYSTSVLWGGLILALETAIGGGITILEAVLDSAIAPFVTRGAVELFVYHELQRIGKELGERYREGLLAVLRKQRDRYVECVESLQVSEAVLTQLRSMSGDPLG
ncbi:MAG: GTPase domain-containing protein [Syntrophobacteraceae bacterium]